MLLALIITQSHYNSRVNQHFKQHAQVHKLKQWPLSAILHTLHFACTHRSIAKRTRFEYNGIARAQLNLDRPSLQHSAVQKSLFQAIIQ